MKNLKSTGQFWQTVFSFKSSGIASKRKPLATRFSRQTFLLVIFPSPGARRNAQLREFSNPEPRHQNLLKKFQSWPKLIFLSCFATLSSPPTKRCRNFYSRPLSPSHTSSAPARRRRAAASSGGSSPPEFSPVGTASTLVLAVFRAHTPPPPPEVKLNSRTVLASPNKRTKSAFRCHFVLASG